MKRVHFSTRTLPEPVFLGYGAKRLMPMTQGHPQGPTEVCSVSGCRAHWPDGWLDDPFRTPRLNRASLVNKESQAIRRSRGIPTSDLCLYAYDAIPVMFGKGRPRRLAAQELLESMDWLEPLPTVARASRYKRLGYDVVVCPENSGWGCSPLSCNAFVVRDLFPNRYYLLDLLEEAVAYARACGREEPEPGHYLIVGVFRRTTPGGD